MNEFNFVYPIEIMSRKLINTVSVIFRLIENDKAKCCLYWPPKANENGKHETNENKDNLCSATYGNFLITLQSTKRDICYIRRVLVVHNTVRGVSTLICSYLLNHCLITCIRRKCIFQEPIKHFIRCLRHCYCKP